MKSCNKIHVGIKAHDKGQVFLPQDLIQELPAHQLLHVEHSRLAGTGVKQNAERQRQIRFSGKIFDGLRFAVLRNLKLVFGQVGDQPAFLVLDVEEQLHHIDIDL